MSKKGMLVLLVLATAVAGVALYIKSEKVKEAVDVKTKAVLDCFLEKGETKKECENKPSIRGNLLEQADPSDMVIKNISAVINSDEENEKYLQVFATTKGNFDNEFDQNIVLIVGEGFSKEKGYNIKKYPPNVYPAYMEEDLYDIKHNIYFPHTSSLKITILSPKTNKNSPIVELENGAIISGANDTKISLARQENEIVVDVPLTYLYEKLGKEVPKKVDVTFATMKDMVGFVDKATVKTVEVDGQQIEVDVKKSRQEYLKKAKKELEKLQKELKDLEEDSKEYKEKKQRVSVVKTCIKEASYPYIYPKLDYETHMVTNTKIYKEDKIVTAEFVTKKEVKDWAQSNFFVYFIGKPFENIMNKELRKPDLTGFARIPFDWFYACQIDSTEKVYCQGNSIEDARNVEIGENGFPKLRDGISYEKNGKSHKIVIDTQKIQAFAKEGDVKPFGVMVGSNRDGFIPTYVYGYHYE